MNGLRDSGEREKFTTGAIREPDTDRGRYDLLPPRPLRRLAIHYERGARKYAPRNWEKGLSWSRCFCSMVRHAFQWLAGDNVEDHLAAVVWNAFTLMHYEEFYAEGCDIPARKKFLPYNVTGITQKGNKK